MITAFQSNTFQRNAFQIAEESIQGTARSGGGQAYRRVKRVQEEKSLIPKLEIVVQNISLDILPVKYSVTYNDIEIQTQSSIEIQTNSTMYPITTQDISINTTQDFYDEQEYLKTILILSI